MRRAPAPSGVPPEREARAGIFLVLEGIDGSGKTEQSRRLAAWLEREGRRVVLTREPTDGPAGRRFRAWARGELEATPEEVLDLFVEDRRAHVRERIEPSLREGALVVCDRYQPSTLAYQAAQGLDRARLRARLDAESFPEPDLVLWLRLPVEVALARLGPERRERFEAREFLARVEREYARLGLEEVDADADPDTVEERIRGRIQPLLA